MIRRAWHLGRRLARRFDFWRRQLRSFPPNYVFRDRLRPGDVVLDVGTGNDPDFSAQILAHYDVRCFGVDPTRKHAAALQAFAAAHPGFTHLPLAVGPVSGRLTFHESAVNVSGSFRGDHRNIVHDPVTSYEVEVVSLPDLVARTGARRVALCKLDLEGVEHELLAALDRSALAPVDQLLVEFHHEIVAGITAEQTEEVIRHVAACGLKPFRFNGRDCLFYR